jgi:hypothetical protein
VCDAFTAVKLTLRYADVFREFSPLDEMLVTFNV